MSKKSRPFYETQKFWVLAVVGVLVVAVLIGIGISSNTGLGIFGMPADVGIEEELLNKVGETVEFDGGKVTISGVERKFRNDETRYQPADGNEFIKVTTTIENTSDEPMSYNAIDFELLGSTDDPQKVAAINYVQDGALLYGDIEPGQSVTGDLYYEVPEGRSGMVVVYTPSEMSGEVVNIKL